MTKPIPAMLGELTCRSHLKLIWELISFRVYSEPQTVKMTQSQDPSNEENKLRV